MDHLHEVTGAVLADPVATGFAIGRLRANFLENRFDVRPGSGTAAGHDGRAFERAFLAAADTSADVQQTFAFDILGAPDCVSEQAVAAVDQDVAGLADGNQLVNQLIHRLAGFDEQDDLARLLQFVRQLLDAVATHDVLALGAAGDELIHLGRRAVERRDGEAFAFHVEHEVLAHHGEADQSDVCF